MAPKKAAKENTVYQLKISLLGSKPPIWRRLQLIGHTSFKDLNFLIQAAMGWTNSHLHVFTVGGVDYGVNHDYGFPNDRVEEESHAFLDKVVRREGAKFRYIYDFGDDWTHDILVEKILPVDPLARYPVCIAGRRACPPEDCGGIWGYYHLLSILQDPQHPEYVEHREWLAEDFDPARCDLKEINARLHP